VVVAKIRERLEENKRGAQKSDLKRFNYKILNEAEGKRSG
jgi:hypothetical protein